MKTKKKKAARKPVRIDDGDVMSHRTPRPSLDDLAQALATEARVDVRTARRWLSGREYLVHARIRSAAERLGVVPADVRAKLGEAKS